MSSDRDPSERYGGWAPDHVARLSMLVGVFLTEHQRRDDGQPKGAAHCAACAEAFGLLGDLLDADLRHPRRTGP